MNPTERQALIDAFHVEFYNAAKDGITWGGTTYCGFKIWKMPSDLQLYSELIWKIRPALIVETGTAFGGSALYMAHFLDLIGRGDVVTIDLKEYDHGWPSHRRILYMSGVSSTDRERVAPVKMLAQRAHGPVMVILDSLHTQEHVLAELDAYAGLVTENSYLVVEDTNVGPNDLVFPEHGPGPGDAVREWLPKHPEFVVDERLPRQHLFSFHTWLKRRRM